MDQSMEDSFAGSRIVSEDNPIQGSEDNSNDNEKSSDENETSNPNCGDVAYKFYNSYAEKRGYHLKKHIKKPNRKREARAMTSHELLAEKYVGMLPAHRKMHDCDVMQMNTMRDAGIGVTQIYGLAANQSGGYERMRFRKRDMFRSKWEELLNEFELHDNQWVREIYDKRKMWATAHIRGNFFAGFRTTSRCEGMHAQVGRYVHYRNNLTEFLKQFSRYLAYTRQRELEADFETIIGEPVLQTPMENIERKVLERAPGIKVVGCEKTPNCVIYITYCYEVCKLARKNAANLDLSKQVMRDLLKRLKESHVQSNTDGLNDNDDHDDVNLRDPARVRTKGCGSRQLPTGGTGTRRTICCSICQGPGHNKKTCPHRMGQDVDDATRTRNGG
ncbi:FAR1-related protein [Sesbania bispinosa]|nr:FAR1-related protein [Sesbania bispinosa]